MIYLKCVDIESVDLSMLVFFLYDIVYLLIFDLVFG